MSSREEFEACCAPEYLQRKGYGYKWAKIDDSWRLWEKAWNASRAHESDLLAALKAITNSGPEAIPIKEAFEMAHRAIERALASGS